MWGWGVGSESSHTAATLHETMKILKDEGVGQLIILKQLKIFRACTSGICCPCVTSLER